MTRILFIGAALAGAFALSACDGGPASKPARPEAAAAPEKGLDAAAGAADRADGPPPEVDPRTQPVPQFEGKPMWAANRRRSAEEAAERQFERNGADFGAKDVEDYVRKAHAFTGKPPAGAETVTRPNGDKLIYDAKSNVFAVVTSDGAPRTMFKPKDGAAYWTKAKAGDLGRRRRGGDGEGRGGEGRGGGDGEG